MIMHGFPAMAVRTILDEVLAFGPTTGSTVPGAGVLESSIGTSLLRISQRGEKGMIDS